jgi:hypothetical protein
MIRQNGNYREDLTCSHDTMTEKFMRPGPQEWQPPLNDRTSPELRKAFMRYVENYAQRKLSFESDIINAFAGVTNWFRADVSLGCIIGLPNATFGLDVLWNPEEYLKGRNGFPSWSWTGWEGMIWMSRPGVIMPQEDCRIHTHYPHGKEWPAELFFLAFYIYDQEKKNSASIRQHPNKSR